MAQEHSPPAGAHFILLGGAVVATLAIFALKWWRGRGDAAAANRHSRTDDRLGERRPREDE